MSSIFGGSKQKQSSQSTSQTASQSFNRAYDTMNTSFAPMLGYANTGAQSLQALLGGDSSGFNKYLDATGFDFARERGEGALTTGLRSRGLANSGGALKSLAQFNTGLNQQYADNYINNLMKQAGLGLQAGQLISGAGNVSQAASQSQSTGVGSGSSKPGIGGFLGSIAGAAAASDKRLKMNIEKVGYDGYNDLNVYQFHYIDGRGPYVGYMAQEVEEKHPEAMGPELGGYLTVDYSKLKKVA